ncbi:MAG TPA: membrane protein insertase YidC [Opitutus sp.]|nr:membrane protein insertase YidC [Opitutus sp.]
MDKKNTFIGVTLIALAFVSLYVGQRFGPKPSLAPAPSAIAPADNTAASPSGTSPAEPSSQPAAANAVTAPTTEFAAVADDRKHASITTLENAYIIAHFTNLGGAVQDVALKKFPAKLGGVEPVVFNGLHADPMLAFTDFTGLDRRTEFKLVSHTATEVVYRATIFDGRVEVTRRYLLAAQADKTRDPYEIRHETTFRNLGDQSVPLPRLSLSVGTAEPINDKDTGIQLTAGYSVGKSQTFYPRAKLEASNGLFGLGAHGASPFITTGGPVVWASVSNQFFASIFTPDQPGAGLMVRRVKLFTGLPETDHNAYGLTSTAQFDVAPLAAHGTSTVAGDLYVGPKEYKRLANADIFKHDQDKVMQFGFFKFFSQILITLMTWIHGWFGSAKWAWGWAIMLTTLTLKTIFVPFTLAASRSAKRMQKIQPEMQAVREKYKDNPQKLQQATMELFKKHKVNPMGGCLPMLITLPFFWGFFEMLRSAAELRFQPFLWATDLTAPDTVGHLFGLPVNILPLLLGAIMVVQMRLTPTPSVDNAQAKMMKLMPYGFALFYYLWPCSLSLYSMINGLFTIGQQLVINRMKDPGPAGPGTAAAEVASAFSRTRPVKNVTPKKK